MRDEGFPAYVLNGFSKDAAQRKHEGCIFSFGSLHELRTTQNSQYILVLLDQSKNLLNAITPLASLSSLQLPSDCETIKVIDLWLWPPLLLKQNKFLHYVSGDV